MNLPHLVERIPPPRCPWVFAVEDTTIQVTWRSLPPGPVRFTAADTAVDLVSDGGPGSVIVRDLPADRRLELRIDADGLPSTWRRHAVHTLAPPPGEELFRFATVSDMHVGEVAFGFRAGLLEHPVPDEAHPIRATETALRDLVDWGAERLVVKGDLTHDGRARDFDRIGRLLVGAGVRTEVILGNHDHYGAPGQPVPELALEPFGIEPVMRVAAAEARGLNLILVNTTVAGQRPGAIAHLVDDIVDLLRSSPLPAFLALHHHGERRRFAHFLPRGIPHDEFEAFLAAVRWARPAAFVTSGHTHRHRRHDVGSVVVTEVGSTKDFPGVWAGYVVHEGGIRQVVRRVATPDLLRWSDHSSRAAFGAWGLWSPGLLGHRCFSHTWPDRPR